MVLYFIQSLRICRPYVVVRHIWAAGTLDWNLIEDYTVTSTLRSVGTSNSPIKWCLGSWLYQAGHPLCVLTFCSSRLESKPLHINKFINVAPNLFERVWKARRAWEVLGPAISGWAKSVMVIGDGSGVTLVTRLLLTLTARLIVQP